MLLAPDILASSGAPAGSSVTDAIGTLHNAVKGSLQLAQGPPGWGSTQVRSMHVGIRETFRVILSIPVRMFAGEKKQLVDV